ncbi:MAG: transaldolase [Candidatus Promineifilaceae bacterium]
MNPLVELWSHGQSFWYDNMRRRYLFDGTIQGLIDNDGLRGMTSNPSIFMKAIGQSDDYDGQIAQLAAEGSGIKEIYEALAVRDIQIACDLFTNLFMASNRGDGYVSLEVSPDLARDTQGTIDEARRLFAAVNRPNLMIKVPATPEGIPAIQTLISEGINVNVTLMFNMDHYIAVAYAYVNGLKSLVANGGDPSKVASVASFFVSRVDAKVDKLLEVIDQPEAQNALGKVAIANCKVVYQAFKDIFHGDAFSRLAAAGGAPQRVLWASTSTKNPSYPDTLYVDTLVGPATVNTMPPKTIDAFRDHGTAANVIESGVADAEKTLADIAAAGVSLKDATEALQDAGVDSFAKAFVQLMTTLEGEVAKYQ